MKIQNSVIRFVGRIIHYFEPVSLFTAKREHTRVSYDYSTPLRLTFK